MGDKTANQRKKRTRANGDAAPYERSDGRWCASYWVRFPDGSRKRRDVYGRSRDEVLAKRREAQVALDRGDLVAAPRRGPGTVGAYLVDWLELRRGTLADTTWQEYEREVRRHIVPTLGHIKLEALKPRDVRRLINDKLLEGLSPQTVMHVYRRLDSALSDAVRDGLLTRNVVDAVDAPKVRRSRAETFTGAEVAAVFRAAANHPMLPVFVLAARTGLRAGELLGLRWDDVDLERGLLRVRHVIRRTGTCAEPKSEAGRRMVPLGADVVGLLTEQRRRQTARQLRAGEAWDVHEHGQLVFTTGTGRPLAYANVLRGWYSVQKRAGLTRENGRRRGLHALRKVYATTLVAGGAPVSAAQRLMGHSRSELTLEVYATAEDSMLVDAGRRADAIFEAFLRQDSA